MQRAKIVQREMKQNETLFVAVRVETKNANILLLSEGEDQLGTLAVGVPQKDRMLGPPMSSVLLGDRNVIVARLLAERLAEKTGKIALASVFAKTVAEKDAGSAFLKLFDKALEEKKEEEEKK